jgi:hypothetical protein
MVDHAAKVLVDVAVVKATEQSDVELELKVEIKPPTLQKIRDVKGILKVKSSAEKILNQLSPSQPKHVQIVEPRKSPVKNEVLAGQYAANGDTT